MSAATAHSNRQARLLTSEELPAAVGDTPGELVRGEFIEMTPTGGPHAEVEANIAYELNRFVKGKGLGKVLCGEIGIITERGPDTVRGADVAFISIERLGQRASAGSGYLDVAPELVVEIVSPNDRWSHIQEKLTEYFAIRVQIVWLVDPKRRQLTVYRSLTDATLLESSAILSGGAMLPGFEIAVAELFSG